MEMMHKMRTMRIFQTKNHLYQILQAATSMQIRDSMNMSNASII